MVLVSYKLLNKYRTIQTTRCKFLGLQSSDDSSTLVGVTSFAGEESRMTTVECITALFYEVDEQMRAIRKHPDARLWPSEVVTLGLLTALKVVGNRGFYRWLTRDYRALFPLVPERTRLFRLFTTHQDWTQAFLATPTVLGVIDTYGIELIHPIREGRSPQQIGRKGMSNHRWIVGGKLCLVLNQWGLIVGWACATTNVADNTFQWLAQAVGRRHVVFGGDRVPAARGGASRPETSS